VKTTQLFASAIAATTISKLLRGLPLAVPSNINLDQISAALSSKGSTRPANNAYGPFAIAVLNALAVG
jgi:hypothetical protein